MHHYRARVSPVCCRVVAEGYPVTLRSYVNGGTLVKTLSLTVDEARKMPTLRDEKDWAFEVVFDQKIRELSIAGSMEEIKRVA
jgi:hypothetical protein